MWHNLDLLLTILQRPSSRCKALSYRCKPRLSVWKVVRVERSSWWLGFPLNTHRSIRAGAFFTPHLLFQRTVSHLRSQKRSYWSQKSGSHPLRTLGVQSLGDPATLGGRTIQCGLSVLRVCATSLVRVTRVTSVCYRITLTFTLIAFSNSLKENLKTR